MKRFLIGLVVIAIVLAVLIGLYFLIYDGKVVNRNVKVDDNIISTSTSQKMRVPHSDCSKGTICDDSFRRAFEEKTSFETNLNLLGYVRHPITFEEFKNDREVRIHYDGVETLFADFSAIVDEKDYDAEDSGCLWLSSLKNGASEASVMFCGDSNLVKEERKSCDKYEIRGKAEMTLTDVSESRRGIGAPALGGKISNFKVIGTPACNPSPYL